MLYVVIICYACYCKICIVVLYHRPNYLKLDILNTPLFFVSNMHLYTELKNICSLKHLVLVHKLVI